MKYSSLLCGVEWQDIGAGLTFFSLEHEFCTISSAGEKILQRPQSVFWALLWGQASCPPRQASGRVSSDTICYRRKRSFPSPVLGKAVCGCSRRGGGGRACCSMRNRRSTDWLGVSSQSVRIVQMLVRESQFSHGFRLRQGHGKVAGKKTAAGRGGGLGSGQYRRWWRVTHRKKVFKVSSPLV